MQSPPVIGPRKRMSVTAHDGRRQLSPSQLNFADREVAASSPTQRGRISTGRLCDDHTLLWKPAEHLLYRRREIAVCGEEQRHVEAILKRVRKKSHRDIHVCHLLLVATPLCSACAALLRFVQEPAEVQIHLWER